MIRECGSAYRFPAVPPQSRNCPIEPAKPSARVATSLRMYRIVSYTAMPALTEPPGELM